MLSIEAYILLVFLIISGGMVDWFALVSKGNRSIAVIRRYIELRFFILLTVRFRLSAASSRFIFRQPIHRTAGFILPFHTYTAVRAPWRVGIIFISGWTF